MLISRSHSDSASHFHLFPGHRLHHRPASPPEQAFPHQNSAEELEEEEGMPAVAAASMQISIPPPANGAEAFNPTAPGQALRSPQSPGRPSFMPSFMRRPRASSGAAGTVYLGEEVSRTTSAGGDLSPRLGGNGFQTRRPVTASSAGGQPSPPIASANQGDPLASFGHRLMRRISNQQPQGGSHLTNSPQRSASTPPVNHSSENGANSGVSSAWLAVGGVDGTLLNSWSNDVQASVSATVGSSSTAEPISSSTAEAIPSATASNSNSPAFRLRLVPQLDANSRSLHFDPVLRDVKASNPALKVGRFTDKQNGNSEGAPRGGSLGSSKVAFKSKVVSRCHAEIWCDEAGSFFIKDTKSSSGTFLNHIRLSAPGIESRPFPLKDGDIVQLGVDYQGGTEEIYRCVKMKVEVGREWQSGANSFNTNALKQLKALGGGTSVNTPEKPGTPTKQAKASVTDCCICLFSVTVCQSLFIAPCSHVFHYKCIRPLLQQHYPGFSCPLCRTFADLEADVETDDVFEVASRRASGVSRPASLRSVKRNGIDMIAISNGASSSEMVIAASDIGDDGIGGPSAMNGVESSSAAMLAVSGEKGRSVTWTRPDTAVAMERQSDSEAFGAGSADFVGGSEEEDSPMSSVNDVTRTSTNEASIVGTGSLSSTTSAVPIRNINRDEQLSNFLDSNTPVNSTFLSHLAERPSERGMTTLEPPVESDSEPSPTSDYVALPAVVVEKQQQRDGAEGEMDLALVGEEGQDVEGGSSSSGHAAAARDQVEAMEVH